MSTSLETFTALIKLWRSCNALGEDVGADPTLVRKWSTNNSIPSEWWRAVVDAAERRNYPVTLELLAGLAAAKGSQRRSRRQSTAEDSTFLDPSLE